jgi:hypothetical protein
MRTWIQDYRTANRHSAGARVDVRRRRAGRTSIGMDLAAELAARGPQDEITIIATLTDRVDPPPVRNVPTAAGATPGWSRPSGKKAAATQATHRVFLHNNGARQFRELWVINGFAVTARASVIRQLASRPGIELHSASTRPSKAPCDHQQAAPRRRNGT